VTATMWETHNQFFTQWCALTGPSGCLVCGFFFNDMARMQFESLDGVQPLPMSGPLSSDQAAAIAAMGLQVDESSTLADVRRVAKSECPGML
jgi:hypothetical protein